MKFAAKNLKVMSSFGTYYLMADVPEQYANELNKLSNKDCDKTIEIKQKRKSRSLTANAYLWKLLDMLSKEFTIPIGDVYIKMIKRYGVYTSLISKSDVFSLTERLWNDSNTSVEHKESLIDVTREFESKDIVYVEFNAFHGTSGYNTKEFSNLLQGVISECEEVGISTLTEAEIKQLMESYRGD